MNQPEKANQTEQPQPENINRRPTTAELVARYLLEAKEAGIILEKYDPEKDAENRLWL